jgi:hypothetical protein
MRKQIHAVSAFMRNAAYRITVDPSSATAWYPRRNPRRVPDSRELPTIVVSRPNVF